MTIDISKELEDQKRDSVNVNMIDARKKIFDERYSCSSLNNVDFGDKINSQIVEFLKKDKNFLVFLGNPGIGKTYFASALVNFLQIRFTPFQYVRFFEICVEKSCIADALSKDFVIIDDFGVYQMTDEFEINIFNFLDSRYNSMKPTVIISNLTRSEIEKKFDEKICSRLFATENTIIEMHDGLDLRTIGK